MEQTTQTAQNEPKKEESKPAQTTQTTQQPVAGQTAVVPEKKSKWKLILIIGLAVFVVGAGIFYWLVIS